MGSAASTSHPVLVALPEGPARDTTLRVLRIAGLPSASVDDLAQALASMEKCPHPVVIAHVALDGGGGRELLSRVAKRFPDIEVLLISDAADVAGAVDAIKAGASDFLVEPLDDETLALTIQKSLVAADQSDLTTPAPLASSRLLLGDSPSMKAVRATVQRVAPGNATVLVRGESGTGKELVARAIHDGSERAKKPFVKLNCAALPDALLESELFGHERGAFTGAITRKPGRVELAAGGTLFLDEIGDITPAMQVKLLRVLQEREFERLGGTQTLTVDVRFVAATHRALESMIETGQFREDLFYRLNVVPMWLPPLRTRREDIGPLARHFCDTLGPAHGKPGLVIEEDAIRALRRERWPGNVRQLQNFIERMVVFADGDAITAANVHAQLKPEVDFTTQAPSMRTVPTIVSSSGELESARENAERDALRRALEKAGGNRTLAARLLGISRRTLYNKMEELGLAS